MDPGSDPKAARRKRVSRACDRCRSKKVRFLMLLDDIAILFEDVTRPSVHQVLFFAYLPKGSPSVLT